MTSLFYSPIWHHIKRGIVCLLALASTPLLVLICYYSEIKPPFSQNCEQREIAYSCGYFIQDDIVYFLYFIFDKVVPSLNYDSRYGEFVTHKSIIGHTLFDFSYRAFEREPCMCIVFAMHCHDSTAIKCPLIANEQNTIVIGEKIKIDFINHEIKYLCRNAVHEIKFPELDQKTLILTPELKYIDTEINALSIYGYCQYCLNAVDRIYFDPPVDFHPLNQPTLFTNFNYGQLLDGIQENEWFNTITAQITPLKCTCLTCAVVQPVSSDLKSPDSDADSGEITE